MQYRVKQPVLKNAIYFTALTIFAIGTVSPATGAELPDAMRRSLELDVSAIAPSNVQWKLQITPLVSRPRMLEEIGLPASQATDESVLSGEACTCKIDKDRLYYRREFKTAVFEQPVIEGDMAAVKASPGQAANVKQGTTGAPRSKIVKYETKSAETAFDGKNIYLGQPRLLDGQGILLVRPVEYVHGAGAKLPAQAVRIFRMDYWSAIGFGIPDEQREFGRPEMVQSLVLARAKSASNVSVEREDVEGTPCERVSIRNGTIVSTFTLDPARNYAVVRREEKNSAGQTISKSEMSGFLVLGKQNHLWIPRSCKVTYFQWPASGRPVPPAREPLMLATYSVSMADSNPLDQSQFVLNYDRPGAVVSDARIEGAVTDKGVIGYRVPVNKADLDEAIERAITGAPPQSKWAAWRGWLIAGNVVLIAVLCVWWLAGRKKPSPTAAKK